MGDDDVDAILQAEASAFERDQEVERVLKAFRLNALDVLDLPHDATERCGEGCAAAGQSARASNRCAGCAAGLGGGWVRVMRRSDIKNRYRRRSLLVHPDKCKHEKAENAFAMLATAQTELLDYVKRSMLTRVYDEAKTRLMQERKLPADSGEVQTPEFLHELRKSANRLLAEIEWEKRKMVQRELEEQGRQASEAEKREEERKRKAEEVRSPPPPPPLSQAGRRGGADLAARPG